MFFSNIAYIAQKEIVGEALYDCFSALRELMQVSAISQADVDSAIMLRVGDFEDALQYYSAKSIYADFIVTRNVKDFLFADIDVLLPSDLIKALQ